MKINPNLEILVKSQKSGKSGVSLRGSSRSGKTWSGIDFIVGLTNGKLDENVTINIVRETFNSFKTTLYEDLGHRLDIWGITHPFRDKQEIHTFNLFGSKINFIGADKPSKFMGVNSDYFFINEAHHVPLSIFNQLEMRCRKMFWLDYNPDIDDEHWLVNLEKRVDIAKLTTTFIHNPYIPKKQKAKILSYNPDNPINVQQGTADEYMWKVYGLGQLAARKGAIFTDWKTYDELPEDSYYYRVFGVDWGGNDPNTLMELNFDKKQRRLFIREHLYKPDILNSDFIKLVKKVNPENNEVVCDSARKDKIYEFADAGINAFRADKSKINDDFRRDVIYMVKEYKLFFHEKSENLLKEARAFSWAENKITGQYLNKPEDANNHCFDAIFYGVRYFHMNFGTSYY